MTPSQALSSLHVPLAEYGIIAVGMDFGKTDGTLIQDSGQTVVCSCGLFWWPTGRMRHGRPVYAVHSAADLPGRADTGGGQPGGGTVDEAGEPVRALAPVQPPVEGVR